KLILASMIVVWALLYFPEHDAEGASYDRRIAALEAAIAEQRDELDRLKEAANAETTKEKLEAQIKPVEDEINRLQAERKGQSILGRIGRLIEPVVEPLGWDWKIGMAALASFPAREVMVGTLGIIYGQGKVEADEVREAGLGGNTALGDQLRQESVFTVPVALSVMVFFALCCQCVSTLVVIRRESNSWRWPAFTFVYMTVLAYL